MKTYIANGRLPDGPRGACPEGLAAVSWPGMKADDLEAIAKRGDSVCVVLSGGNWLELYYDGELAATFTFRGAHAEWTSHTVPVGSVGEAVCILLESLNDRK